MDESVATLDNNNNEVDAMEYTEVSNNKLYSDARLHSLY